MLMAKKNVSSKIESVNVFLSRAEIQRKAISSISSGMSDIILSNLSQNIDPNSIQVTGKGDFIIMSVTHRLNHLNKAEKSEEVTNLQLKIKDLEDQYYAIDHQKQALNEEKSLILTNKKIGGANSGVDWEQLENIADFYRERLVEISTNHYAIDKKQKVINTELNDYRRQLNVLTTSLNKPTSDIIVKVQSNKTQNISLDFNYMVYNAGWTPLYDFRAEDGNDKIKVAMKANVYQNTGVDWNNVDITLSTGNPSLGVTKPNLNPWYLHLQTISKNYRKGNLTYGYGNAPAMAQERLQKSAVSNRIALDTDDAGWGDEQEEAAFVSDFVNTNMKQLSTEYNIKLKHKIKSDNKRHLVNIKEFDVNAEFNHAAVPKLDKDAFLMANITEWQKYDWITSELNVFYDGTYIGKTLLDVSQVEDTLSLSLGRDKKVVITREKIKDYCATKSIGLNKKKLVGYEITVRNNKQTSINLNLQDQIPISMNEQVEVKVTEISGAKKDETNGYLDWDVKLKPGETKKFEIKFEVKYPRKYYVTGL